MNTVTSTFAKAFVAYAAPVEFAGEIYIFICHEKNIFYFRRFMEPVEAGRPNFVAATTAKV
jgi:hypothetical protein